MVKAEAPVSQEAVKLGYEPADVRPSGVGLIAAGVVATIIAFALALWAMIGVFSRMETQTPTSAVEQTRLIPPKPRLQTDPLRDLAALRAQESQVLESYDWVDRQAGTVRIPIDRAIAILARQGWPRSEEVER